MDESVLQQPRTIISAWFKNNNRVRIPKKLNEAKVVFLGDGGAGKTFSIQRLLNNCEMQEEFSGESTPGISIQDCKYEINGEEILIHYWDFGGQEIMHSMHRMFLTKRTLYVVFVNARGMPIQLIMFEDRIEIHNPGGLYGRITIDQLGKIQPDTRNPVLASALETLGIIENRYSGIPTIRMEMEKYNLRQPEFLDERGSFIVKLYKESKNDYEDMSNDEETNNLIVFCKTPRTRKEICDYLGLNSVTYAIQTYVNPLVEAGVIKLSIPDKPKSPKQLYYSGEREK